MKRRSRATPLTGYSGYEVVLWESADREPLVVKRAVSQEQNERLRKQYEKHRYFAEHPQSPYRVPTILTTREDHGLFSYSYRYVEGVTLLHFLELADKEKIRVVLDRLLAVMREMARSGQHFEERPRADTTFAIHLKSKLRTKLVETPLPRKAERELMRYAAAFPHQGSTTICHGDFTFDNIIVDPGMNLWFLDFLEAFYPHHWLDFGKLFQDVDAGWYELKYGIRLPYNKLAYVKEYLLRGIAEFDPEYSSHHSFFLALNLLRNLPYLTDPEQRKKVVDTIAFIIG